MIAGPVTALLGTLIASERIDTSEVGGQVSALSLEFESTDLGDARFAIDGVDGLVVECAVTPHTDSHAPTSGWDLRLYDTINHDIMVTQEVTARTAYQIAKQCRGILTVDCAGMGNAKRARVALWVI